MVRLLKLFAVLASDFTALVVISCWRTWLCGSTFGSPTSPSSTAIGDPGQVVLVVDSTPLVGMEADIDSRQAGDRRRWH
jgi:hypothetical protein